MRLLMGLVAAAVFAFAGYLMVNLQSQSGNTVAEAFDHAVGVFSFGMAVLSIAVAVPHPGEALTRTNMSSSQSVNATERSNNAGAVGEEIVPVEGWDPIGARICPFCGELVGAWRTTHCNHCGKELVERKDAAREPVAAAKSPSASENAALADRLVQLEYARSNHLITEEEYAWKRAEMMSQH